MGKSASKNIQSSGDTNVQIINSLENHSQFHEDHDIKLWIILALVVFLVLTKVYQILRDHNKKQTLKLARSVATLQQV